MLFSFSSRPEPDFQTGSGKKDPALATQLGGSKIWNRGIYPGQQLRSILSWAPRISHLRYLSRPTTEKYPKLGTPHISPEVSVQANN